MATGDASLTLDEAVAYAHEFENLENVVLAIYLQPTWLTTIPTGRKWSILHQVVLSGDLLTLDQVLSAQKNNPSFRLLTQTRDNPPKTVVDIAKMRKDDTTILQRIERLETLYKMLQLGKDTKWDECYKLLEKDPALANEKPPYRRYYLIHHIACVGAIDQFKRFQEIPNLRFELLLRADNKTIVEIAKENGQNYFADYISQLCSTSGITGVSTNDVMYYQMNESYSSQTSEKEKLIITAGMFNTLHTFKTGEKKPTKNRKAVMESINMSTEKDKLPTSKELSTNTQMTPAFQESLQGILQCPITHEIFRDPGKEQIVIRSEHFQ